LLPPHPAYEEEWSTSFRKTYLQPNERSKAVSNTKAPVGELEFDNSMKEGYRKKAYASGF
jgi:hypothetical protein